MSSPSNKSLCLLAEEDKVTALRECLCDISGLHSTSCHVWIMLWLAKQYDMRLKKIYLPVLDLAYMSYFTYQMLSGFASYCNHSNWSDLTDEETAMEIGKFLKIFHNDTKVVWYDTIPSTFWHAPYPSSRNASPGGKCAKKHANRSVWHEFPKLPAGLHLNQVAATMCLDDIYRHGIYGNIYDTLQGMWESRVSITVALPSMVMVQLRFMQIFAKGQPDDFLAVCIMHTWETLGRRLLAQCGHAQNVTDAYNYIVNTTLNHNME